MYDAIIIGGGAAGYSAALYLGRAELKCAVVCTSAKSGGQLLEASEIDNYLGMPAVNGAQMADIFKNHALKFGAEIISDEAVKILERDNGFIIKCIEKEYETRAVIIASGGTHKKLGIPKEEELTGRGVSYCATCDGAFFKNKTVAVVGGGDTAVFDALHLAKICEKVYLIHRRDEFKANKHDVRRALENPKIHPIMNTVVEEICGENKVDGVIIKSGERARLDVNGVFIAIGTVPLSGVFEGIVKMDDAGFIIANEDGKTSKEGIFAAGDIRTKSVRQVVTAVADGANTAYAVEKYLQQLKDGV